MNIFKEYNVYYEGPLNSNNKSGVDVYIKKDFYVDERHDLKLIDNCRLEVGTGRPNYNTLL